MGDSKTAMNGGLAGEDGHSVGGGKDQVEVMIDFRTDGLPPKRGLETNAVPQQMGTKAAKFNH